jgi:hypothetical protein
MPPIQELTPLYPEELERLRAEWNKLPVHDPRRRVLAMFDLARADAHVLRQLLADQGKELRELRAALDQRG